MCQTSPSRHIKNGAVGDYQTKIHADASGKTQIIFYQTPVVTFDDRSILLNTGELVGNS